MSNARRSGRLTRRRASPAAGRLRVLMITKKRGLERRGIDPVIPVRKDPSRSRVLLRRFRYDARNDILKCRRGKIPQLLRVTGCGRFFCSRTSDCTRCPLKGDCLPKTRISKEVVLPHDYPALIRARRRHARWSVDDRRLYRCHIWRSEGYHREAKNWHGPGARGSTRPRQHEDPSLPHDRGDQPQAARHRSPCHSLGYLSVSSRREASAVHPSCPHTPN